MTNSKCVRLPTDGAVAGLEPTDYIPPETLESGDPQERGRSFYADQTGQLDAGVWECEPNRHVIEAAPYDEFVYLLQGRIDVIDDQGGVETYKAGDSFMMPRGCKCTWDVKEPVRKLYVVLTAEAYRP
ncbi:MAG: cupin domain-containing protein [Kiloniellales bacterium]|nr:cupin domain-containing protein [Kiloniellales bacterium]